MTCNFWHPMSLRHPVTRSTWHLDGGHHRNAGVCWLQHEGYATRRSTHLHFNAYRHQWKQHTVYGVATISRLLKIIGLFCRISSLFYGSFAKETYNFNEPTNRSHPTSRMLYPLMSVCTEMQVCAAPRGVSLVLYPAHTCISMMATIKVSCPSCYRVAKTHRMPEVAGHFLQKNH